MFILHMSVEDLQRELAHKAIIGEEGPEFVIDSDTTAAIEGKFQDYLMH